MHRALECLTGANKSDEKLLWLKAVCCWFDLC